MAIRPEMAERLKSLPLPKPFSVCELGDQGMGGEPRRRLASAWYAEWGCDRYVSVDGNGRGTITADLNQPLLPIGEYDLVTDFGTGEHIFDQAQVWRTLHRLVEPGGYIVFDRPAQGYEKHCFYLTNECVFRNIAEANGYRLLWLERTQKERGQLLHGAFRVPTKKAPQFRVPQQDKYHPDLVIAR